jgi:hypothetical protein
MSETSNTYDETSWTPNLNLQLPAYSDERDIGVINDNMTIVDTAVTARLKINQGAANAGKFMVVNNSGNVVPTTVPFANGGSF